MTYSKPEQEGQIYQPDPPWLNVIDQILSFRWVGFILMLPIMIPLYLWLYFRARRDPPKVEPLPPSRRPTTLRANCLTCRSDHLTPVIRIVDTSGQNSLSYQRKTLVQCLDCGAVYVECDEFDSFCVFSHDAKPHYDEWYELPVGEANPLVEAVTRLCQAPQDPHCTCALHVALRADCNALPHAPDLIPQSYPQIGGEPAPRWHPFAVDLVDGIPRLSATCSAIHPWDWRTSLSTPGTSAHDRLR